MERRTYRMVEGDRIEGTWRPIFIRNLDYHLTELFIYADRAIYCSDAPLRALAAREGELGAYLRSLVDEQEDEVVTGEERQRAFAYFADRERDTAEYGERARQQPADGPKDSVSPPLQLGETVFPEGWPKDPGTLALRNEYPAPITVDEITYPTVIHAYWALSTTDVHAAEQICRAERVHAVKQLGEAAPRRDGWAQARVAVMAALLRAKFDQHPQLAETLLATGDGRIRYSGRDSPYWVADGGGGGRNWIGRLLEVVRSELAARRAGIAI